MDSFDPFIRESESSWITSKQLFLWRLFIYIFKVDQCMNDKLLPTVSTIRAHLKGWPIKVVNIDPLYNLYFFYILGLSAGPVPHPRISFPDLQRVWAVLQVHEQRKSGCVLWGYAYQAGRRGAKEELPAHCGGNTRKDPCSSQSQEPQPQEHQTFHTWWMWQDARAAW